MEEKDLREKLLPLLEQMIACAETNDRDNTFKLSDEFTRIYDESPTSEGKLRDRSALEKLYDNCRQSCAMSFSFPRKRNDLLNAARDSLEKIREYKS